MKPILRIVREIPRTLSRACRGVEQGTCYSLRAVGNIQGRRSQKYFCL